MAEVATNSQADLTQLTTPSYNIEQAVLKRYEAGAKQPEALLCCPTDGYEPRYLELLPEEIVVKDYGCGDPTRYVNVGETVVDLGSGAGKSCYILAQKVGETGRVVGVDFNPEMLALSRKYLTEMGEKIGYRNLSFVKGKIQDLALDLDRVETYLQSHPITNMDGLAAFHEECDRWRVQQPLIATESVDVVISNCVLNLVKPEDKRQLFAELFRVLKQGGRAVISDIVCDEDVTLEMMQDPQLWSGCIAGAFREDGFLQMFADAGFYGIEILVRQAEPWQVVNGIEFRSMTVRAYKGSLNDRRDRNQALIYKGPWKTVVDDNGNTFFRGQPMAVCNKTFALYTQPTSPYSTHVFGVQPHQSVCSGDVAMWDCDRNPIRHPRETKGSNYQVTKTNAESSCCPPCS
jgi:arsenite methyltransferase